MATMQYCNKKILREKNHPKHPNIVQTDVTK